MRIFVLVLFCFPVFAVNADIGSKLKSKSKNVSSSIVSDVSRTQKTRSKLLKIQMRIDELRAQIGGTAEQTKKQKLQAEIESLLKQQKQLRNSLNNK